jgi:hypothetical protein
MRILVGFSRSRKGAQVIHNRHSSLKTQKMQLQTINQMSSLDRMQYFPPAVHAHLHTTNASSASPS